MPAVIPVLFEDLSGAHAESATGSFQSLIARGYRRRHQDAAGAGLARQRKVVAVDLD